MFRRAEVNEPDRTHPIQKPFLIPPNTCQGDPPINIDFQLAHTSGVNHCLDRMFVHSTRVLQDEGDPLYTGTFLQSPFYGLVSD